MKYIDWFKEFADKLPNCPIKDIWSDGGEILCKTESIADSLADVFEDLYKAEDEEVFINTGYYDPIEDERNGFADIQCGQFFAQFKCRGMDGFQSARGGETLKF